MFENFRRIILKKNQNLLEKNELIFFYFLLGLFFILSFLSKIEIETNDDIFVYFNYARNTAEGRFFAIDNRNIPGEGFSSMLYMLILVPFHWIGMNPMLYGVIINLTALYIGAHFIRKITSKLFLLSDIESFFVQSTIFCLLVLHPNIIGVAGWAFETLYSLLFFTIITWISIHRTSINNLLDDIFFVSLYWISYLIRPENIVLLSPMIILYFLSRNKNKNDLLKFIFLFLAFFSIWIALKYLVFKDVFPTGYYRKFSNSSLSSTNGLDYFVTWISTSKRYLGISFLSFFLYYIIIFKRNEDFSLSMFKFSPSFIIIFLFLSFCLNCLFVIKTTPLVGYFYRYLIICNTIIIIGVSILSGFIIKIVAFYILQFKRKYVFLFLCFIPTLFPVSTALSNLGLGNTLKKINIIADTDSKFKIHPYIKFGTYLKNNLSFYKDLIISMGDGGALPYAANCITIDPAGLTEPYIAKLAKYNGSDKVKKYSDYILSYKPDIIMVTGGLKGTSETQEEKVGVENHLPITQEEFIKYLQTVSKKGFIYLGSLSSDSNGNGMPYDWHIIIDPNKDTSHKLASVLKRYIDNNGYYKVDHYSLFKGKYKATFTRGFQRN